MAELEVTYEEAPDYPVAKVPTVVATYEKKSFKSYERVSPVPSTDRHDISDDVDGGGGYGNE